MAGVLTLVIFFPRFVTFPKLKAFQRSIFSVQERKQAGFLTEIQIWDTHCGGSRFVCLFHPQFSFFLLIEIPHPVLAVLWKNTVSEDWLWNVAGLGSGIAGAAQSCSAKKKKNKNKAAVHDSTSKEWVFHHWEWWVLIMGCSFSGKCVILLSSPDNPTSKIGRISWWVC